MTGRRALASTDPPPEEPRPSILVVDDDEDLRQLLVHLLSEGETRRIDEASSAAEARVRLVERRYDVVITDLSMPEEGGLSLMQWSQRRCPGPAWVVLTGHGTMDAAVGALQLGAFDFLEKPLKGIEPIRNSVRNALAHQRLLAERDRLHAELEESNAQLREHLTELERAYRLLREQADNVRDDLHRAAMIQRALLPQAPPRLQGVQVHALYRPSHSIGGDLYDVVQLDDRRVILLIADAAGHGLSAALLAVLFRSQLRLADPDTGTPRRPCDVLKAANRALCEEFPAPGLFLTAAYCLLDTHSGTATIASAGHPPLLLLRKRGGTEQVFHTGPALGLSPGADYAQQEVTLEARDQLLFYSDGVYERLARGSAPASEKIAAGLEGGRGDGLDRLRRAFAPCSDGQRDDDVPEDDMTLMLLDASPGESRLDNGTPSRLPTPAPPRTGGDILVGSDSQRTTLSIQGSAEWGRSASFHAACVAALEAGRSVMIDLTLCQYLDSTFLGALHELCERAEEANVEFRLQGVTPAVEALFVELGMRSVMDRVVPRMLPLPTSMQPVAGEADPQSSALLTLRAHEALAGLSDRNRQEFDPLLALLRREVAAASG